MDEICNGENKEILNVPTVENAEKNSSITNGDETKADKFKRLAIARTDKIVDGLEKLGNLSGNNYEYTEKQIEEMYSYIQNALDKSKRNYYKQEKETFSFSE